MKRKISLILSVTMLAASLAACGGSGSTTSTTAAAAPAETKAAEAAAPAASGDKITIIMGHEGNDDLPDGIMALKFNELLEERSGGRIVVDYKSNGTLGDEDELVQQVMNGSIQATPVSTSTFSNYTDIMNSCFSASPISLTSRPFCLHCSRQSFSIASH